MFFHHFNVSCIYVAGKLLKLVHTIKYVVLEQCIYTYLSHPITSVTASTSIGQYEDTILNETNALNIVSVP